MKLTRTIALLAVAIPSIQAMSTQTDVKSFTNNANVPVYIYLIHTPLVSTAPSWTQTGWMGEQEGTKKITGQMTEVKEYSGFAKPGETTKIQYSKSPDEILLVKQGANKPNREALLAGNYDKTMVYYDKSFKKNFSGMSKFNINPGPGGGLMLEGVTPSATEKAVKETIGQFTQ